MAELLVDFITSLDGFGAAEGWPGYWGMDVPEYTAWLEASPERDHTILMGATTYRLMSGFASGALDAQVRAMKDAGTAMRTLGSLMLCRALLKAGLVDRFRVVVFPVVTGATGRDRIYDGWPDVALDLRASRTFDGRLQLLEYTPTVLAGPPSGAGAA